MMDLDAIKEREDGEGHRLSADGLKESPNGLRLGKRTYFQDAGAPAKPRAGLPVMGRRVRASAQGGHPPRCQVEGCNVDLTGVKAYYCRHKVCSTHSKSPKVIVGGIEQRFCQQCSRFHHLSEFDQGKRSCRRRLAGHNARRRKPPLHNSITNQFGRFPSSFYEEGRMGLWADVTSPRNAGKNVWPTIRASERLPSPFQTTEKYMQHVCQGDASAADMLSPGVHPFLQCSSNTTGFPVEEISPGYCFSGVSDPGCALSLLSPQPLGSKGQCDSGLISVNQLLNGESASVAQRRGAQLCSVVDTEKLLTVSSQWSGPFPPFTAYSPTPILEQLSPARARASEWSFRSNEASNSHNVQSEMELKQEQELPENRFHGELELVPHAGRQLMDPGHLWAFSCSNHYLHWGL